jgi:hypothetical protein
MLARGELRVAAVRARVLRGSRLQAPSVVTADPRASRQGAPARIRSSVQYPD